VAATDDDGRLNFLPAAPWPFLNRQSQLAEIAAAARRVRVEERRGLIFVVGPEGIGKTTLAVHAGYRHRDDFADVQLYEDLGGSSATGPAQPADVLARWLRQLGRSDKDIPAGALERAALFRSLTYRRRILIVLDDVHSAAQIKDLLPSSPTALVIAAGRRWFDGLDFQGFTRLSLGRFTAEVAVELLGRSIDPAILSDESDAVRELISVCEGSPLALRVASARIARRRRSRPVTAFVEALRSQVALAQFDLDGERPIEAVYDLCYRELTADQATAYRMLALHPGPDFGAPVAAAMLGIPVDQVAETIEDLQQLGQLLPVGSDRSRFHTLVGLHAHRCAIDDSDESQRTAAVGAAVAYYTEFVVSRARSMSKAELTVPKFAGVQAAYQGKDADRRAAADLAAEEQNMRAVVTAAEGLEMFDECVQLGLALRNWLYNRDRTAELADLMAIGVRVARRGDDPVLLLKMLREVATAYEKQGDRLDAEGFRQALAALHEARPLAERLGDALALTSIPEWEGLLYEARGLPAEALERLLESRRLIEAVLSKPDRPLALSDMHLGRVLIALGRPESAAEHLDRALRYFDACSGDSRTNLARTQHLLGAAALAQDRLDDARRYLDVARSTFEAEGFASQELKVLRLLIDLHLRRGDRVEAVSAARAAVVLAQRLGLVDEAERLSELVR
jgi:tetratricopeptide (TPR) repeat protein